MAVDIRLIPVFLSLVFSLLTPWEMGYFQWEVDHPTDPEPFHKDTHTVNQYFALAS